MLVEAIAIGIAALSLVLSGATAWATLWRRGHVRMAQPPTIYFGPDGDRSGAGAKIFIRGFIYTTGRRGQVIESLFARVRRGQSTQTFNIWVYGERSQLRRGSGLHVNHQGVSHDHHFLLPADGTNFEFLSGQYKIEVLAQVIDHGHPVLLCEVEVTVTSEQSKRLCAPEKDTGLYFDWGPDSGTYSSHLERARVPSPSLPPFVLVDGRSLDRAESNTQSEAE